MSQWLLQIVLIGIGATAIVDAWSWLRLRWLGVPAPDYALVGRWFGHMRYGRLRHVSIRNASAVRGERWLGWSAHYAIGIGFAALLPVLWGASWLQRPSLLPALVVGIVTVAAPWLVMQPAMGAGIAARRSAQPAQARWHSLLTHFVFGLGLYAAGWAVRSFVPT